MFDFLVSLLKRKRKIFSPFGFFEVESDVFFDWKHYNFRVKKIISQKLPPEKRELIRKINGKIRLLDDHPFLYSLIKIQSEIQILKKEHISDTLFIQELEKIESKFTRNFQKKIFEVRLRSILEHLEYIPYTNIISRKEILEEIHIIENTFSDEYHITRLTQKLKNNLTQG